MIKAKLAVKPEAKPSFIHPWMTSFVLEEPIETELEHLEKTGVIE